MLSRSVIENSHISLLVRLIRVFTIVGTAGNAHAARLFPKESCTCLSTGLCYHIMAATEVKHRYECITKSSKNKLNQAMEKHKV